MTTATQIRKELKSLNITAKVKTSSSRWKTYIDITVSDLSPSALKQVQAIEAKYTNENTDTYVTVHHGYTQATTTNAMNFLVAKYENPNNTKAELIEMAQPHIQKVLNGMHRWADEFWNAA